MPVRLTTPLRSADAPSLAQHVAGAEPDDRRDRIREKAARLGVQVSLPGDDPLAPETPVPEVDWIHYGNWPSQIHATLDELEDLERVVHLMQGGATDHDAYSFAMDIIANGQRGLRAEIARTLIAAFPLPESPAAPE